MTSKRKRLQQTDRSSIRVTDVARLAGCSTATVSRAQNTPHLVSPETLRKVQAAIRELGYMPNSAARALRSNRSRLVGIVIPSLSHAIYASLVGAAQRRLMASGYSLLVSTFEYDLDLEEEQVSLLVERGTEGVILIGAIHRPGVYDRLQKAGIPYINTYVYDSTSAHPCIGIDNRRSSAEIAEFLHDLGHRSFAAIAAPMAENDRASARIAGIRDALGRHGLALGPERVVERPYTVSNGREALRLLMACEPRPTAVICGNDILALGALIEAREMGLAVPADLSIVGFDDLEFTQQLDPPLTTVEVPAKLMGEGAAGYILDALDGKSAAQTGASRIRLDTRLVARRSTAAGPGG